MRRAFNSLVIVSVVVLVTASVSAAPRERGKEKEKVPAITKIVRIIRSLGDGLTVPLP